MILYNKKNREQAINDLMKESFKRITLSFYKYVNIENPQELRDDLYKEWFELGSFGRIYIAKEGLNAQMSIPENNLNTFISKLYSHAEFNNIPIKYAVKDDGKSFYKLIIKVRPKIVADGLDDNIYDVTNVGKHLTPFQFHELSVKNETIVVDMRNHYESEVGKFKSAYCPDADTFREAIDIVVDEFQENKNQKLLLYCTGGIRCEKASAYLKHHGFKDVNQLYGGIIAYANEIQGKGLKSNFIGKNFVFDERLGESIDGQIISKCHQCGEPCDSHTNCANDDCHLLFIQCTKCSKIYNGCCTQQCNEVLTLSDEERIKLRIINRDKYSSSKTYKSRLRPYLMNGSKEEKSYV